MVGEKGKYASRGPLTYKLQLQLKVVDFFFCLSLKKYNECIKKKKTPFQAR